MTRQYHHSGGSGPESPSELLGFFAILVGAVFIVAGMFFFTIESIFLVQDVFGDLPAAIFTVLIGGSFCLIGYVLSKGFDD